MKHIEKAFSFLIHIFRAADKVKPRDEYWFLMTCRGGYWLNKRFTSKAEIENMTRILSNLPKTGKERFN